MANNKTAQYGDYTISIEESGTVKVTLNGSECKNTIAALRDIAKDVNFTLDDKWNTRQAGKNLIDYFNKPDTPHAPNEGNVIVLNRMYVGDYLTTNLGHEVINMYQADDDNYYLYLNAYGSFAKDWQGKVKYMLLSKYHDKNCIEILGKAINLSDIFDYDNDEGNNANNSKEISQHQLNIINDIKYGGVHITDLFSDSERQNVYITFKAEKVYKIAKEKNIYIHFVPQKNSTNNAANKVIIDNKHDQQIPQIDIYLYDTKLALASLYQFFEQKDSDYELIYSLFSEEHSDFWIEINDKAKLPQYYTPRKESIFDICKIKNDENDFSNALEYFLTREKYKGLWCDFFKEKCSITLDYFSPIKVNREENCTINNNNKTKGRIDLAIRNANTLILIENKIKSGINKKESDIDGNQLTRYSEYVKFITTDATHSDYQKESILILLTPEYNKPKHFYDGWIQITYKTIYDFLTEKYKYIKDDKNFTDFYDAMHRHTHENVNDYLYYEMQEKLYRRIKEYNNNK